MIEHFLTDREARVLLYWHDKMSQEYEQEADFLKNAKDFCEMLGKSCLVVREAAATKNGVADLLLCYNGQFVACELKRIGGVPSPQQLKFIDRVKEAGGQADVCRSLADVWNTMRRTAPES
jgi:RecB family endonuclease NucS